MALHQTGNNGLFEPMVTHFADAYIMTWNLFLDITGPLSGESTSIGAKLAFFKKNQCIEEFIDDVSKFYLIC